MEKCGLAMGAAHAARGPGGELDLEFRSSWKSQTPGHWRANPTEQVHSAHRVRLLEDKHISSLQSRSTWGILPMLRASQTTRTENSAGWAVEKRPSLFALDPH
jgi:hypothetical protein